MAASLCTRAMACPAAPASAAAPAARRAAAPAVCGALPAGPLRSAGPQAAPLRASRPSVAVAASTAETVKAPSAVSTSTKYAIVEIAGTQMLVEEGRWYSCNRLEAAPGSKIQLGRVVAYRNESDFSVGQPYLDGVTVEAEVVEELRGPKILVYKMKPKKHYRRMAGHRQPLSKFKITKIAA